MSAPHRAVPVSRRARSIVGALGGAAARAELLRRGHVQPLRWHAALAAQRLVDSAAAVRRARHVARRAAVRAQERGLCTALLTRYALQALAAAQPRDGGGGRVHRVPQGA
eukprot:6784723-Prymnesium_polylepis.2